MCTCCVCRADGVSMVYSKADGASVCVCVAGHTVPVWVRKGSLVFPPAHQPVLLVGPGTGCAPFRSVLHERTTIVSHSQGMLWYVTKLVSHARTTSRSCELKYYFIGLVVWWACAIFSMQVVWCFLAVEVEAKTFILQQSGQVLRKQELRIYTLHSHVIR